MHRNCYSIPLNPLHVKSRAVKLARPASLQPVIFDMEQPKKRKRGGQQKPASERKRNNVTIRLVDDLRAKLETASQRSGRSLSEEMAWRLTMSFLFNTEIQRGVAHPTQLGRGHGGARLRTVGWRVGLEEIRQAISDPQDETPIFIPPKYQQLLKERREERSKQHRRKLDEQRAERGKVINPARVSARRPAAKGKRPSESK